MYSLCRRALYRTTLFDRMWSQPSYHLPNLHNVVLRHRADDPGLVGVPREVRDLGCVASVDELVERRTIFVVHPYTILSMIEVLNLGRDQKNQLTSSSGGPSSASSCDCSSPILLQMHK